jgi:DedD protein
MPEGKKAYYQVSFTGGQALAAVVVMIGALGLAFFLGSKAGFEKGGDAEPAAIRPSVSPAPAPAPRPASETSSAAPPEASTAGEEAPVFEDREAGVAEPAKPAGGETSPAPSRTEISAPAASRAAPGAGTASARPPAATPPAAATASAARAKEVPAGTARPAPGKSGFFVQIVSTSSKSEATRWKEKLSGKGYRTASVSAVESKKGTLWRVRVGPYADKEQAKKAAAKISADFKQKAWVAPE